MKSPRQPLIAPRSPKRRSFQIEGHIVAKTPKGYDGLEGARKAGVGYIASADGNIVRPRIAGQSHTMTNFAHMSYLGMNTDEMVKKRISDVIAKDGVHMSLSRGHFSHPLLLSVEAKLEKILGRPSLLTRSTADASMTYFLSLRGPVTIAYDKHVHFTVQGIAARLVRKAVLKPVRHNDLAALERLCQLHNPKRDGDLIFATDYYFSAQGDKPDVPAIAVLMRKYKFLKLFMDDAHMLHFPSRFWEELRSLEPELQNRTVTVSSGAKTLGVGGGFLTVPTAEEKRKILNGAGTHTLGIHVSNTIMAGFDAVLDHVLSGEVKRRGRLIDEKVQIKNQAYEHYFGRPCPTPGSHIDVIPVCTRKSPEMWDKFVRVVRNLQKKGFLLNVTPGGVVSSVYAIRLCLNYHVANSEIWRLYKEMANEFRAHGLQPQPLHSRL